MQRIATGLFHESNAPFVYLVRCHVRQLDAIDLRNPRCAPAVDIIEFLAPAFDLKNFRKNVSEASAIVLKGFRFARPMAAQRSEKIAYCRD